MAPAPGKDVRIAGHSSGMGDGAFQAVVTAVAVTGGPVRVSGVQVLTSDYTVPSAVLLDIPASCPIGLAGHTLTINGPIRAGTYPIFSGAGSVVLGPVAAQRVRPEWFAGGYAAAVASMPSGGSILLGAPTTISAPLTVPATISTTAEGQGEFQLNNAATIAPPGAPTLAQGTAGNVPLGLYTCEITYTGAQGETTPGPSATIALTNALAPPTAPVPTTASGGGTWPAATAWVQVTYTNSPTSSPFYTPAGCETLPSSSGSVAVPAGGTLTIPSPPGAGNATGWFAYVGTGTVDPGSGGMYRQQTMLPTAIGTALTLTAGPTPAPGGSPPTTATASVASLQVASPGPQAGATGWYAYLSAPNGTSLARQQLGGQPTAIGTALTTTTAPAPGGGAPPRQNTTAALVLNGPLVAGRQRLFAGAGVVAFAQQARLPFLPEWWGGVADARLLSDAAVVAGSPTVTSAGANFTAADVGKVVTVGGIAQVLALAGTVLSVQSATQCTASVNAAATLVGAVALVGTDNAPAVQAAIDAAATAGGGTVLVGEGDYAWTTRGTLDSMAYSVLIGTKVALTLAPGARVAVPPYPGTGVQRVQVFAPAGTSRWVVEGGVFYGQYPRGGEVFDVVVVARGGEDWRVHGVEAHHFGGKFVWALPNANSYAARWKVTDCHYHHGGSNAVGFTNSWDGEISGNHFHDTTMTTGGETINGHSSRGMRIVANHIVDWGNIALTGVDAVVADNRLLHTRQGIQTAIGVGGQETDSFGLLVTTARVVVTGNTIDVRGVPDGAACITVDAAPTNDIQVEGNTCIGGGIVANPAVGGTSATQGVVIRGNHVTLGNPPSTVSAIAVLGTCSPPGVLVEGNVCDAPISIVAPFSIIRGNSVVSPNAFAYGWIGAGADSTITGNIVIAIGVSKGSHGLIFAQNPRTIITDNMCISQQDNITPCIEIGGTCTDSVVADNLANRSTGGTGNYAYIQENAGADRNLYLGNRFVGNAPAVDPYIRIVGPASKAADCPGFNPRGHAVAQPAVPAASTDYTNVLGVDCSVAVVGGTGVAVSLGGVGTGLAAGMFRVPVGQRLNLGAYTAAPTWQWYGD